MNTVFLAILFFYFLLPIISLVIFYYVVKAAVKNGIKEARSER